MSRDIHTEIRKAAMEWEALRAKIEDALPQRAVSEEGFRIWCEACDAWHSYESILDTFWKPESLQSLEAGDPELLEIALAFVEVDPYYFRSGYLKKRLFRRLKRLKLSNAHRQRLLQGILDAVQSHRGDGWKDFCLLAGSFSDIDFANGVSRFLSDSDPHIAWRAQILLKHIQPDRSQSA